MGQITREELPEELTWDLTTVFESDAAYQKAFTQLQSELPKLAEFQGHLADSADRLLAGLEEDLRIERAFEKLYVYAHQKFDQDTANATYAGMNAQVQDLLAQVTSATAFFQPEVLGMDEDLLSKYLKEEKLLPYQHFFDVLLSEKAHTLPADQEALLAGASTVMSSAEQTFSVLDNADIDFGDVMDENGEIKELTNGLYAIMLRSKNPGQRQEAFQSLYDAYMALQNTFASTLSATVKKHNFLAKVRHYQSAQEAAVTSNQIPVTVYQTLEKKVDENLSLLHRYVALRKRVLGQETIHNYDLYVSLVDDVDFPVTYEKAKEIALAALAPLGEDYLAIVKKAFAERWIDVVENKGKRSGAYSGGAYDTNPYILLNWQDTLDNVYTLVHEMGHTVHSYLTRHNQPYHYGDYPIFLAEIASTTNESLLTDYLLKQTDDDRVKAFILNQYLDGFKGTVFRQTQFAEFEAWIHEQDAAGQPLTAEVMADFYGQLNQKFYGPDVLADPEIAYEWTRIPHFYYNFYVYQYATGEAAATSLAQGILTKQQAESYKDYLKAGSSENPLAVMRHAGVDMEKGDYLDAAFAVFDERLTQLEKLLKK
ncbi:oligoendopeptidase F [Fructobacillus parabroussonetiae]|uniref:Oligopeptidase F n=1 Tax=Fructobacillus parabroussonetiae TaxID=2713174 RepID=A0ABS5QXN2_9LACO|nr:oligoendopeptidase F [Fructobacillus parabroussonetiae]MBS9337871.1 oligoendopeptidase F [Fructobacillus parabroussonetiae]